jgi:hypothetical protein
MNHGVAIVGISMPRMRKTNDRHSDHENQAEESAKKSGCHEAIGFGLKTIETAFSPPSIPKILAELICSRYWDCKFCDGGQNTQLVAKFGSRPFAKQHCRTVVLNCLGPPDHLWLG